MDLAGYAVVHVDGDVANLIRLDGRWSSGMP